MRDGNCVGLFGNGWCAVNEVLPEWENEDIKIAVRAAHVMANHFREPVVILLNLVVQRHSLVPNEIYLERVVPKGWH